MLLTDTGIARFSNTSVKKVVQVLGFHQRDGLFVYRADVGQHVAGFQPGEKDLVIKYLAAPVSFVPEDEPAGLLGAYDGFQLDDSRPRRPVSGALPSCDFPIKASGRSDINSGFGM